MPTFEEMNKKVNVSIGLILALIFGTFLVTSFYLEMSTLEERVDKRYKRVHERLEKLEQK